MSDSFKTKWKAFLKEHGSMTKASAYSYKLWKNKYQSNSSKEEKPKEEFKEKILIPGKIYACLYANLDEMKTNKFVDHWPIIFATGQIIKDDGKVYETGLDLNLIPPPIRSIIIDKLYTFFNDTISINEKNINESKKGKKAISVNFKILQNILRNTGFEKAYVTMLRDKMGKIKVIDYNDWPAMVSLYTEGVRGKGISKIYDEYIKSMGKQPAEKKSFIQKLVGLTKK